MRPGAAAAVVRFSLIRDAEGERSSGASQEEKGRRRGRTRAANKHRSSAAAATGAGKKRSRLEQRGTASDADSAAESVEKRGGLIRATAARGR